MTLLGLTSASTNGVARAQTPNPSPSVARSQTANPPPSVEESEPSNSTSNPPPDTSHTGGGFLSSYEFLVTLIVSTICLIALAMEFFLLKGLKGLKAEDALRVFGVTLVIFGTLFLITAGFDVNQIAPALGLFGTVAGYLLGKNIDRKEVRENAQDKTKSGP